MKIMNRTKVLCLICTVMIASSLLQKAFAQFQQLPTPQKENKIFPTDPSLKIEQSPLILPFWDDFSIVGIDSSKWLNEGVMHSFTVGNSAPSLGVILLDGVDETGRAYSNTLLEQGETDRITSQPIDLSGISSEEANTVFFSFYWQAGGKAELPDANDELSLQFLNDNGIWDEVWNKTGAVDENQNTFTSEIIQVNGNYFHNSFQFRFQTSGRRSGPFDSWILDYIYLNKNRSLNDLFFEDRALTTISSSPFEKYTAIPFFELIRNPENYFVSIQNEFNNLSNRFRAMEFTVEFREKESQNIIQKINNNSPFNPVPLAQERRMFTSNPISSISLPDEDTDWEIVTYLSSGDNFLYTIIGGDTVFFEGVDYRLNDTARTTLPIRDFFAYDDGSLDYSAGINQRSGMLAVRYEMSEPAFLNGLSINFSNFNQVGRGVDIMIWNDLEAAPIFAKEFLIPEKASLSDFSYFDLGTSINVNAEFYVGFMQFTNEFIYVGLDKARDTGEEIFYNVSGSWQQNESVAGSLMIRPHLSLTAPLQEDATLSDLLNAYPNPVQDILYVDGDYQHLEIFDSFGRRINLPIEDYEKGKILNFEGIQKGIYLVKVFQEGKHKSIRVLVN